MEARLRTLQKAMEPRQNNFHLCRMIGALFIIFVHSIEISGLKPYYQQYDPAFVATLILMGKNALRLFFLFSGIMVAMSLEKRASLSAYAAARAMRIFPPLLLFSVIMVFVIGPLMTNLPVLGYFSRLDTWLFLPKAASGLFVPDLPGVFETAPYPILVNPSLWTLLYEILCYIVLALLWAAGWLHPRRLPLTLTAVAGLYLTVTFGTNDPSRCAAVGALGQNRRLHPQPMPVVRCPCVDEWIRLSSDQVVHGGRGRCPVDASVGDTDSVVE